MIKINWNSYIKNRMWFGWLWSRSGKLRDPDGVVTTHWPGKWRRVITMARFVPVQMAWHARGA